MSIHPLEPLSVEGHSEIGEQLSMSIHPLEPLSASEIQQAVAALKSLKGFSPSTRIISIMLNEPAKSTVYDWPNGAAPRREAVAVLFDNAKNSVLTVTIDLGTGAVTKSEPGPAGAQPTLSIDEQVECEQAVLASKDFKAALEKHYGITDTSLVMVDIWTVQRKIAPCG